MEASYITYIFVSLQRDILQPEVEHNGYWDSIWRIGDVSSYFWTVGLPILPRSCLHLLHWHAAIIIPTRPNASLSKILKISKTCLKYRIGMQSSCNAVLNGRNFSKTYTQTYKHTYTKKDVSARASDLKVGMKEYAALAFLCSKKNRSQGAKRMVEMNPVFTALLRVWNNMK